MRGQLRLLSGSTCCSNHAFKRALNQQAEDKQANDRDGHLLIMTAVTRCLFAALHVHRYNLSALESRNSTSPSHPPPRWWCTVRPHHQYKGPLTCVST